MRSYALNQAMLEFLDHLFAAVCGQNPEHTWAPGGVPLPFCQRCTGLYVGAAIAWLLHCWLRPRPTTRFLQIHGAFLLYMAPCGFHWLPQGPVLRTLSGVLFGFAVVAFLWLPMGDAMERWARGNWRFSRRQSVVLGSAGVPPAVFGLWPKTPPAKHFNHLTSRVLPTSQSARRRPERPGRSRSPLPLELLWLKVPSGQRAYAAILAATLVLVPLLALYGGKPAAYALCGLAFGGALALGALVLANAVLGLCGIFRLVSSIVTHLRISSRNARTSAKEAEAPVAANPQ
jgi:uncharacterized membrane protein